MKIISTLFFVFILIINLYAKQNIFGNYRDNFGNKIELRKDSTFLHEFHFDMSSSWTIGTWTNINDTIIFKIKPIYDTLRKYLGDSKKIIDTLVLSSDKKIDVITSEDDALNSILSGGQNRIPISNKLYFKKGRLYEIEETGKLKTQKVKGFWTNKKYYPWYEIQYK